MKARLALIPAALLFAAGLTACSSDVSDDDGAAFVKHVREFIPSTAAYEDDYLIDIAKNVCRLGSVEDGVRILDNYSQLEAEDYRAFATSALTYACPDKAE